MKALPLVDARALAALQPAMGDGGRRARQQRRRLMAWLTAVWCERGRRRAPSVDNARFTATPQENP